MTGPDGDAEPLRVPPWLAGHVPAAGTEPGPVEPPVEPRAEPPVRPPVEPPVRPPVEPRAEPAVVDVVADEADWPVAPDRDGWHATDEPSELRRRLTPWWPRLIVAGVATALSLLAILLVSALLGGGGGPDRRAAPPAGAPTWSDVSMPGPTPAEATRAPSTVASATTASATTTSTRSSPRSSPPVTFGPVTYEAEAPGNTRGGSAWVDRYPGASGGSIVRNIGDWGSRDGDGFLRFENVTVPVAGTYTLRLFHVNIDNERTRTAVVTVAGRDPQRVTLTGGSTCCTGSTLKVQLRKDGNTITVSNPDGHAPSVDRIVLSLP
ncbi:hypothetical protein ACFO1B_33820 [Dactylosporangium siamense]|uniref:CBM6 domain-containing protein n=1 Tax=Dactylosporangium siamense TaxID=685454 RepID=A0A919U4R5_9ACTN|nr:hypothetical protein [Dactylosporangium siamense]GIG42414.1 hypothetical protein Dsi01nite_004550 [Dactylosporangium siamense]